MDVGTAARSHAELVYVGTCRWEGFVAAEWVRVPAYIGVELPARCLPRRISDEMHGVLWPADTRC